jgi:hypothetical protein
MKKERTGRVRIIDKQEGWLKRRARAAYLDSPQAGSSMWSIRDDDATQLPFVARRKKTPGDIDLGYLNVWLVCKGFHDFYIVNLLNAEILRGFSSITTAPPSSSPFSSPLPHSKQ